MSDTEGKLFELKVGIFVTVGIIIFFILVFSIGDVNFIKKGYHIGVTFNFANGISESAPVRVAGINVGEIDKIDVFFDEKEKRTKVTVWSWINNDKVKIGSDSIAVINTLGLLGEKYLEILSGENTETFLKNGDIIVGRDPIPTALLMEKMAGLADSADVILTNLKEGKGTIGKFLTDDAVYNNIEEFTADIKKHPWKLLKRR